jgi:acyl carrier protein
MGNSVLERVSLAVACAAQQKDRLLQASDRLVDDLGFDSLRIAMLALELEAEFGEPFLINDWIAETGDVSRLTVGSLAEYVGASLEGSG